MLARALPWLVLAGCVSAPTIGEQSEAQTFPNDQPAFDYFLAQGLLGYQAAGIVGNLDVESGVDPTAVQAGGPGRGIAQWSLGGRWDTIADDNAVWYAGTLGEDVETLDAQLRFIWYELTTFDTYGLADLRASTDVSGATLAFMSRFEVCGVCVSSKRIADAQNVLALYGADRVDLAGVRDDGIPCTIASGESGVCIDTVACAALPDHESTAGYCPGAANIECCTSTASPSDLDAGAGHHHHDGCDAAGGPVDGTLAALFLLLVRRRRASG